MFLLTQIRNPELCPTRKRQFLNPPAREYVECLRGVAHPSSPLILDELQKAHTACTPVPFVLMNGWLLLSNIYTRKALLVVSTLLLLILPYHCLSSGTCHTINLFGKSGETKHFRSGGSVSVSFAGVMSVMDKVERNNTVVITVANPAYELFLENWDCYAKPLIGRRFLVYTTDYDFGLRISEKDGYHVLVQRSELNKALNFGTTAYQQLMLARTRVAAQLLEAGKSVLIADNDAVWLSDPLPYLDAATNADIVTSRDGTHELEDAICGGFLYLKHTPTTKRVWGDVTRRHQNIVHKAIAKNHLASYGESEQMVINEIFLAEKNISAVKENGMEPLRVHFLDPLRFPNGLTYFTYGRPQEENVEPVVIHNNWIVGHDAKHERFLRFGLWAVALEDHIAVLQGEGRGHRCTIGK